jgi:hypothetical protein
MGPGAEAAQARAACLAQFVRLVLLAPGVTEALTPEIKVLRGGKAVQGCASSVL